MTEEAIRLSGGNVSEIVRIGNTVHRSMGPWSPAVHDLLRYLEAKGFSEAPKFLGIDEQGREVLTFIELAAAGNTSFQRMLAEGHLDHYRREIEALHRYRDALLHFLQ